MIDPVVEAVQTARRLMEREPPTLTEECAAMGQDVDEYVDELIAAETIAEAILNTER